MSYFKILFSIIYFILSSLSLSSNVFGYPGSAGILILTIILKFVVGKEVFGWFPLILVILIFSAGEFGKYYLKTGKSPILSFSKDVFVGFIGGGVAMAILLAPVKRGIGAIFGAIIGSFLGSIIWVLSREETKKILSGDSRKNWTFKILLDGLEGILMMSVSLFALMT